MTKNNAAQAKHSAGVAEPNLDSRYGEIGISAVAAALPYRSEVKKLAEAPASQPLDRWLAEMAA